MSSIKLFQTTSGHVEELETHSMALEQSLQRLIERNLEIFLGVRFLDTEYTTGSTHRGRIDTLGIDENGCPVIIEYKRSSNENVINQGLFYLNWLMDHKAEFEILVMRRLGNEVAQGIEWGAPRVLCIAGDFTRYDEHAVQQINRNIELIRYRRYGEDFLLLETVNTLPETTSRSPSSRRRASASSPATSQEMALNGVQALYQALRDYLCTLGDDVQERPLAHYIAFKRLKNFACVLHQQDGLKVLVKIDITTITLEPGFTRDVSMLGHWGTGNMEITLKTPADLRKAEPFLSQSYESN